MKTGAALLLSTFLAALCGSLVHGNGVCYDPDHVTTGRGEASIIKDMATIRAKGFTHVRTYISKFGNTEMAQIIANQGMTLALGVPYGNADYATQLESAVKVAQGGNVQYLFIGNENLRGSVPDSFIQEIKNVKARVPGNVKVGTVQRNTEFLENIGGLQNLISACDAIAVNIHPFFTADQNGASNAIELTKNHWTKIKAMAGDKLVLGETGWPSQGSYLGNTGSTSAASGYFSAYNAWTDIPGDKRFYFQMFDVPSRAEDYEKAYGIFTSDSQDKYNVGVSQTATSAPVSTPAPTSAPTSAPTQAPSSPTPAPTPAPTPGTSSTPEPTPGSSSTPEPTTGSSSTPEPTTGSSSTPEPTTSAPSPSPSSESGSNANSNSTSTSSSEPSKSSVSETGAYTTGSDSTSLSIETSVEGSQTSTSSSPLASSQTTSEGAAGTTATAAPVISNGHGDPVIANESDVTGAGGSTTETNTQSEGSGSSVGVAFGVAAGCAAVLGAFGFIYQTRKKAQELEEAEGKASFSVTPHGGCVL